MAGLRAGLARRVVRLRTVAADCHAGAHAQRRATRRSDGCERGNRCIAGQRRYARTRIHGYPNSRRTPYTGCAHRRRPPYSAALLPSILRAPARAFERIFIIVFENHGAAAALANPYFKQLAGRGAYLSNYYAVSHPSEPNYLAMLAGDPLVSDDGVYNLPQKNLVDLLEPAGIGWKAYQENYPGGCFAGSVAGNAGSGLYARKHNPFISFDSIRSNRRAAARS